MQLLMHKQNWKKWVRQQGMDSQPGAIREPLEYPCYAYATVASFGMEELQENYLYIGDVRGMLKDLE